MDQSLEIQDGRNSDPAVVAFHVLKELYLWFGFEEDKIPYTKIEGDAGKVNFEEIAKLR